MLSPTDAHLYQAKLQFDYMKKTAKLVMDLCDINSDWDYIADVISNSNNNDIDLDETKLSEGANSIYLEYFKVPQTKFLS